MPALYTDRLALREPNLDDAEFVVELLNEPDFLRYIGDRGVRNLADAQEYLETGPMDSFRRLGFGMFVVEPKDGREAAGICGLIRRDWLDGVDLGFAFLERFRTRGYAFESSAAVVSHAGETLGLERVLAVTTHDNLASIGLLKKLGFTETGAVTAPDEDEELLVWTVRSD
jgi:RimJ/RimL family protein N-acetyltransferase